ncbi:DUF2630 family protein [Streptomyces sp. NPDC057838]|uniref:DUF2630 family protein n=1 Tax=unclassified Streptomyces TaxID=2593676 RepID=UPI0036785FAB
MEDPEILRSIRAMAEEERRLRDSLTTPGTDGAAGRERLVRLERELDQCWDLLRQRRARREFGQDPDEARTRSRSVVEGYRS